MKNKRIPKKGRKELKKKINLIYTLERERKNNCE